MNTKFLITHGNSPDDLLMLLILIGFFSIVLAIILIMRFTKNRLKRIQEQRMLEAPHTDEDELSSMDSLLAQHPV